MIGLSCESICFFFPGPDCALADVFAGFGSGDAVAYIFAGINGLGDALADI